MNDGFGGGEIRAGRPAAVLDAEDIQRKRVGAGGNDTVLADDAVLLAAADKFAGEEKKRPLAAIDENELIDAGSAGIVWRNAVAAIAHDADAALFADDNFAGSETLFEGEEMSGVIGGTSDDGEDADVFVSDGVEQAPVTVALGRVGRGRWIGRDKAEQTESGNADETAEEGRKNGTIHEKPPETRLRRRACSATGGRTGKLGKLARRSRNLERKRPKRFLVGSTKTTPHPPPFFCKC